MVNKLKGYTILEILMAMIISSIVLISAYNGMDKISLLYHNFRHKNEIINEVTLLNKILLQDFSKSTSISVGEKLLKFNFSDKKIEYLFSENNIIRKSISVDTFYVPASNISLNFVNDSDGEATIFVNELYFESDDKGDKDVHHYYKNYGADALINLTK